jgi:hypothetical protein
MGFEVVHTIAIQQYLLMISTPFVVSEESPSEYASSGRVTGDYKTRCWLCKGKSAVGKATGTSREFVVSPYLTASTWMNIMSLLYTNICTNHLILPDP